MIGNILKSKRNIITIAVVVIILLAVFAYLYVFQAKEDQSQMKMITANLSEVGMYDKFEIDVDLEAQYTNPYDFKQIDLYAIFTSPSGKIWRTNGFFDGKTWLIRLAPNELGKWKYKVHVKDMVASSESNKRSFKVIASENKGWVKISPDNNRYFVHDDLSTYFGVGVAFPWNVTTFGLDKIKNAGGNFITYWNGNYDGAGNRGGQSQLMPTLLGPGQIDQAKSQRIDQIVDMLDERDMKMSFVIWPHDSLADNIDWPKTWDSNGFSKIGPAKDFFSDEKFWPDQEILYRYIIARWGHSSTIGLWGIVCEINGTDGWQLGSKSDANKWTTRVQEYFVANDPYRHITSGSMSGSLGDYWIHGYQTLDISDRENYYDSSYTAFAKDINLRWNSFNKPLITGETGYYTDVNKYHDILWVGWSNGLAMTPVWWAIDNMDIAMFGQMKVFSEFTKDIDFGSKVYSPVPINSYGEDRELPQIVDLEDYPEQIGWEYQTSGTAIQDASGKPYVASYDEVDGKKVVSAPFRLENKENSFGTIKRTLTIQDWFQYDTFTVPVYLENNNSSDVILAKPVLYPGSAYNEVVDEQAVTLEAGKWVNIELPLRYLQSGYMKNAPLPKEYLKKIRSWGLKVYSKDATSTNEVVVKIGTPQLKATSKIYRAEDFDGYAMKSSDAAFGWMIPLDKKDISGIQIILSDMDQGTYDVSFVNTWTGEIVQQSQVQSSNGELILQLPSTIDKDTAFKLSKTP
jgi:hypothetical protein